MKDDTAKTLQELSMKQQNQDIIEYDVMEKNQPNMVYDAAAQEEAL